MFGPAQIFQRCAAGLSPDARGYREAPGQKSGALFLHLSASMQSIPHLKEALSFVAELHQSSLEHVARSPPLVGTEVANPDHSNNASDVAMTLVLFLSGWDLAMMMMMMMMT
jgi:hypothetical protein